MAGIFNIFNESENTSVSFNKAKGVLSTKQSSQILMKPKGLSIRSKSDLNVSNYGINTPNTKDIKKINDKQCLSSKPVSPIKLLTPKKKSIEKLISKKLSPKISSPIMQNVRDDFVFKKPSTPKNLKKVHHPEPEKLAYDFDISDYMTKEMENIFKYDATLMRSHNNDSMSSNEDEGFISDTSLDDLVDTLDYPTESFVGNVSPLPTLNDIELPDISDDEF